MRERDGVLIGVVVVLGILLLAVLGGGIGMMGGWGWMGPGMMGGWGTYGVSPWWGIAMAVLWVLIIVGIGLVAYWAIRRFAGTQGDDAATRRDRALEILRERYARGEITQEQYEEMRRTLQ